MKRKRSPSNRRGHRLTKSRSHLLCQVICLGLAVVVVAKTGSNLFTLNWGRDETIIVLLALINPIILWMTAFGFDACLVYDRWEMRRACQQVILHLLLCLAGSILIFIQTLILLRI